MATVETMFSEIIPQQLMRGVMSSQQKRSAVAARIYRSSRGVTRLAVGSSGWKWERAVSLGLGGVARHVPVLGPGIISDLKVQILNEAQTYPAPLEATQPGYDRMTGTLSKIRGNIVLDETILQENELSTIITDHYQNLMRGVQLRIVLNKLAKLFTPNSDFRHICAVSSWTLTDANNGNFIPSEGNEVMFHEGQMVQFYDLPSSTTISHRHTTTFVDDPSVRIMVRAVDPITRNVYVQDIDGLGRLQLSGNAVADGDIVVNQGELAGGASGGGTPVAQGSFGFVDWMVNTGSILGVDTADFIRLRSFIKSNLAGPWTEDEGTQVLTWFQRWHDKSITTLFMTAGVLEAHRKTQMGYFQADRTAKPVTIVGGHAGISHFHNGKVIEYLPDPYMRSGFVLGQYVGEGNIEELHPPKDPSSRTGGQFSNEVQFKAWAESNYRSIFRMVSASNNSGAVMATTLREAPFSIDYQLWPMMFLPGILVGGCTELNWSAS